MARNIFNVVIDKVISAVRVKVRNEADDATWAVDASGCGAVAVQSMKPDGANTMPAMDTAARPGFQRIVDSTGTNTLNVVAQSDAITSKYGIPAFVAIDNLSKFRYLQLATDMLSDGKSANTANLVASGYLHGYNGSTFDRLRSVNTGQLVVTSKDASGNAAPAGDAAARAAFHKWVPGRPSSDLGATALCFDHGIVTANYGAGDEATAKTQSSSYDLWITDLTIFTSIDPGAGGIPIKVLIIDISDSEYRWFGTLSIHSATHINFNTPLKIPRGHQWRTAVYLGGSTNLDITIVTNGHEEA